jgi:hypothetical protein
MPAATHYPPGYPAVLAILWRLFPAFPANTAVFLFANVGFLCATSVGAWYFGHRRLGLSSGGAAVAALATVACVPVLTFGVFVLSEPMFMALLFPVLLASERAVDSGKPRDAALAGLLAGVLAMVRTMGQFVAPALVLALLLRRRRAGAAVALVATALLLVPWQIWVARHAGDIRHHRGQVWIYGGWLSSAVSTEGPLFVAQVAWKNLGVLRTNLWEMLGGATDAAGPAAAILTTAAFLAVLAILALGARHWAVRARVSLYFTVLYLAVVLVWPFEPTRFVWVLLPLLRAARRAGHRCGGRAGVARVRRAPRWRHAGSRDGVSRLQWSQLRQSYGPRPRVLLSCARRWRSGRATQRPDDLLATMMISCTCIRDGGRSPLARLRRRSIWSARAMSSRPIDSRCCCGNSGPGTCSAGRRIARWLPAISSFGNLRYCDS